MLFCVANLSRPLKIERGKSFEPRFEGSGSCTDRTYYLAECKESLWPSRSKVASAAQRVGRIEP